WSVRSTLAMDAPVLLSLNVGDNLCIGHNPDADGGFGDLGEHCYAASELRRPEAETRRNSENVDRALTYIRENPGTTLRRTVSKARITLEDDSDGLAASEDYGARPIVSSGTRDALRRVANGWYAAVCVAAVGGAVVAVRRRDPAPRFLFRENPGRTLRRTVSKARITLEDDSDGLAASEDYGARPIVSSGTRDALRRVANGWYAAVCVAAVGGAVVAVRRRDPAPRFLFL